MLIEGYCFGIRSERRLCEEVHLNLAYRWFCRLGLDGRVPDYSTLSKNRHGRFRESDAFRHVFEAVVQRCIDEKARDVARSFSGTPANAQSTRERKTIEMLFAHWKRIIGLRRLRLRGPNGARDEFLLAATVQNLRNLAKMVAGSAHQTPQMA